MCNKCFQQDNEFAEIYLVTSATLAKFCPGRRPRRFFKFSGESDFWKNSINFLHLDKLQKRRLHQICFPVIKKTLYLSSKLFQGLGKCPKTFVASYCLLKNPLLIWNKEIVLQIRGEIIFGEALSSTINKMLQFIEFSHYWLDMSHCEMDPGQTLKFVDPDLPVLAISVPDVNLETILKLAPKLQKLCFHGIVPIGWEKMLSDWNNLNLEVCQLNTNSITDSETLFELVKRQNLLIYIRFQNTGIESFSFPSNFSRYFFDSDSGDISIRIIGNSRWHDFGAYTWEIRILRYITWTIIFVCYVTVFELLRDAYYRKHYGNNVAARGFLNSGM